MTYFFDGDEGGNTGAPVPGADAPAEGGEEAPMPGTEADAPTTPEGEDTPAGGGM